MFGLDSVVVAIALHTAPPTATTVGMFTVPIFMQSMACSGASGPYDKLYGIGYDGHSAIYACDENRAQILKYDMSGNLVLQWGRPPEISDWDPHSVTVSTGGEVFVTDNTYGLVFVFSPSGGFRRVLGDRGRPLGLFRPTYMCATAEGTILISDSEHKRLVEITPEGVIIRSIGSFGVAPGQLGGPRGIAMDAAGHIYVADEGNRRVTVYSRNGDFLQQWPMPFQYLLSFIPVIRGIRVDDEGRVHVTDTSNSNVTVFTPDGSFIARWGVRGDLPGQLQGANDIVFDRLGHLYISQFTCSLQKFARDAATVVHRTTWGKVKATYR